MFHPPNAADFHMCGNNVGSHATPLTHNLGHRRTLSMHLMHFQNILFPFLIAFLSFLREEYWSFLGHTLYFLVVYKSYY